VAQDDPEPCEQPAAAVRVRRDGQPDKRYSKNGSATRASRSAGGAGRRARLRRPRRLLRTRSSPSSTMSSRRLSAPVRRSWRRSHERGGESAGQRLARIDEILERLDVICEEAPAREDDPELEKELLSITMEMVGIVDEMKREG
jgi:hypothetical protein